MWKSDWYNYYYHSNTQIGKQWKNEWEWRNKSPGFILQVAKATRHLNSFLFTITSISLSNEMVRKKLQEQIKNNDTTIFFDETHKT